MARYTGPKTGIVRKSMKQYSEMTKHSKEEVTPGQHGWRKKRKKSEYAIQLMEEQKYSYGI
jgi:small subunit ribosomal protein S4